MMCRRTPSWTLQLRRLAALERQKIAEERPGLQEVRSPTTRTSWPRLPGSGRSCPTSSPNAARTATSGAPNPAVPGRHARRGPHPRGGGRRHHHPGRLRQAHPLRRLPGAAPRRQGRAGAQLRSDDVVEHFFVTTTHHWLLFFTNLGRVYRRRPMSFPRPAGTPRASTSANLLAFQPGEEIAQVLDIPDYQAAPYLVLATRRGGSRRPGCRVRLEPGRRRDRDQSARGR